LQVRDAGTVFGVELKIRPKYSRRDINVTRPRLWTKSRDETWTCRDPSFLLHCCKVILIYS